MGNAMPHQGLVVDYFAACTAAAPAVVASHFTADAVIYDTNHPPVRGSVAIGEFWAKIRRKWAGAVWTVESHVEMGDHGAIEWSMRGTNNGEPFVVHGSEHYRFENGKIAEIRQYWTFDADRPGSGLVDYPYARSAD